MFSIVDLILHDPKTIAVPVIDILEKKTFEYKSSGDGTRGVFDWNFDFHELPRFPGNQPQLELPFDNPIMQGSAFAIRKDYFHHLGGFDEQLIKGRGDNYELSLKTWLCGGLVITAPCSRVGHAQGHNSWRLKKDEDFSAYNFKRIAEVRNYSEDSIAKKLQILIFRFGLMTINTIFTKGKRGCTRA